LPCASCKVQQGLEFRSFAKMSAASFLQKVSHCPVHMPFLHDVRSCPSFCVIACQGRRQLDSDFVAADKVPNLGLVETVDTEKVTNSTYHILKALSPLPASQLSFAACLCPFTLLPPMSMLASRLFFPDCCSCLQPANKLKCCRVLGTAAAASLCANEHKWGGLKEWHRAQRLHRLCR